MQCGQPRLLRGLSPVSATRAGPAPSICSGLGGVHRWVIDTLTGSRDRKLKSLGYMLEQCRKLRVAADYDIDEVFPPGRADIALAQCRKILNRAEAAPPASGGGR